MKIRKVGLNMRSSSFPQPNCPDKRTTFNFMPKIVTYGDHLKLTFVNDIVNIFINISIYIDAIIYNGHAMKFGNNCKCKKYYISPILINRISVDCNYG
jgi:hypothetical protein